MSETAKLELEGKSYELPVIEGTENGFIGEAELYNGQNKLLGKGKGTFVKSKMRLDQVGSYKQKKGTPSGNPFLYLIK